MSVENQVPTTMCDTESEVQSQYATAVPVTILR